MARMTMHVLTRKASRSKSRLSPLSPKRIELKVPMCCEGCEENVRGELTLLEGVKEIDIDVTTQKVIVLSHYDVHLEPCVVLNAVKKVKHRAELWRN
ncbi:hypothetical protein MPTK1_8g09150 [Marchantia polymorpha subsp. ruderalis]|uniref:HMA domain-containing protein n=1 Tax=Marchantia polymorpha TaxID=3197 RepID=A0A2R6WRH0_MARPO|nr:hypothetical protein MARPO_0063s0004 [Marchantia polymorpha]BBN19257.1 hypothetical protein Mp_8g09150 [Marchantia polymorpha subsp. ruderalis]|eukprot:PTQ36455.1 hypothetical protein MARPO_0063s0004 [Marchantia polymorpha]